MDVRIFAITIAMIMLIFASALLLGWEDGKQPQAKAVQQTGKTMQEQPGAPLCNEGEKEKCAINLCPGEKICIGGEWTDCLPAQKKCVPNSTIACAYDNCRFGVATCDACGGGYGKCVLIECEANEKCVGA